MPVTVKGTPTDLGDLAAMLGACAGRKVSIDATSGRISREAGDPPASGKPMIDRIDNLVGATENLVITVGRNQAGITLDSFSRREINLSDVEKFPASPPAGSPSATTRCEVLIHILAEYKQAMHAGRLTGPEGFPEAHQAGYDAQTEWRKAAGQEGPCHGNTFEPPNKGVGSYCNGSKTTVTLDELGHIMGVTPAEPPKTPPPSTTETKSKCFITTAALGSEVHEVLAPLHRFRDDVVKQTRSGRRLFADWDRVYYRFSPAIAAEMDRDPEVRGLIRDVVVVPWINYVRLAVDRPGDWTLTKENRELVEFLSTLRAGLDSWADSIELPRAFDGLGNAAIVGELNIILSVVLPGRGDDYLTGLRARGALPLRVRSEAETAELRTGLSDAGRSEHEIALILDAAQVSP